MLVDEFVKFCLDHKDKAFINRYLDDTSRSSVLFRVPIQDLDRTKGLLKKIGYSGRIVYRGPRTNQIDPSFTRKKDAVAFSVYPR
jgi:hypothetical protein